MRPELEEKLRDRCVNLRLLLGLYQQGLRSGTLGSDVTFVNFIQSSDVLLQHYRIESMLVSLFETVFYNDDDQHWQSLSLAQFDRDVVTFLQPGIFKELELHELTQEKILDLLLSQLFIAYQKTPKIVDFRVFIAQQLDADELKMLSDHVEQLNAHGELDFPGLVTDLSSEELEYSMSMKEDLATVSPTASSETDIEPLEEWEFFYHELRESLKYWYSSNPFVIHADTYHELETKMYILNDMIRVLRAMGWTDRRYQHFMFNKTQIQVEGRLASEPLCERYLAQLSMDVMQYNRHKRVLSPEVSGVIQQVQARHANPFLTSGRRIFFEGKDEVAPNFSQLPLYMHELKMALKDWRPSQVFKVYAGTEAELELKLYLLNEMLNYLHGAAWADSKYQDLSVASGKIQMRGAFRIQYVFEDFIQQIAAYNQGVDVLREDLKSNLLEARRLCHDPAFQDSLRSECREVFFKGKTYTALDAEESKIISVKKS